MQKATHLQGSRTTLHSESSPRPQRAACSPNPAPVTGACLLLLPDPAHLRASARTVTSGWEASHPPHCRTHLFPSFKSLFKYCLIPGLPQLPYLKITSPVNPLTQFQLFIAAFNCLTYAFIVPLSLPSEYKLNEKKAFLYFIHCIIFRSRNSVSP